MKNKCTTDSMIDCLVNYACSVDPVMAMTSALANDICTYLNMCKRDKSGNFINPDKVYLNGRKIIQEHHMMKKETSTNFTKDSVIDMMTKLNMKKSDSEDISSDNYEEDDSSDIEQKEFMEKNFDEAKQFQNSMALSVIEDELDSFTEDDLIPNISKIKRLAMSIQFGDEKIFMKSENRKVFYDVAMSNLAALYDHYDESADIDTLIKINVRDEEGKLISKIKLEYRFEFFEQFLDLLQEHFLCTPLFEEVEESSDESDTRDDASLHENINADMENQIVNVMSDFEKGIHIYERASGKKLTKARIEKISIIRGDYNIHIDNVFNDDVIQKFVDRIYIDPSSDADTQLIVQMLYTFDSSDETEVSDELNTKLVFHNVREADLIWTILNRLPECVKSILLYDINEKSDDADEENTDADDACENEAKTYWSEVTAMDNNCEMMRILEQIERTTEHPIRNAKIIKICVETKDGASVNYVTGVESDDDLKEIVKMVTERGTNGKPFIVRVWVETMNGVKGSHRPKYLFKYVYTDVHDILKCVDRLPNKIKNVLYFQ